MSTDTTFFTNEPNATLIDRFKVLLKHSQFLDIIVGYFRISGFNLLRDDFEKIDEIRIINGINVDRGTIQAIEASENQIEIFDEAQSKKYLKDNIKLDLENSEDSEQVDLAIKKFIELLKSKKIKIKQHRRNNIHAKVYICRLNPETQTEYGKVITGSSNFSHNGLKGQYEFNVELKNSSDVKFALERFEELWNDSDAIDVNSYVEEILLKETWINEDISPYELYLKVLYEHFKDEINQDKKSLFETSENILKLTYQKHAVIKAKDILDTYGGVFIADVVGLGKTYVSALLAKQLPDVKKTIICPPVLKENWKRVFDNYKVTQFDTFSGDGTILKKLKENYFVQESEYIFIDEAHRFRNAETETYNDLYELCEGKKIILITATPLNNRFLDILSQLRLFLKPRGSNIPGVPNLNAFFNNWHKKVNDAKKDLKDGDEADLKKYFEVVRKGSEEIREKVLSEVMVRRTRTDIKELYKDDMKANNFEFPDVEDPIRLVYEFDKQTDLIFEQTLELFKNFKKVRYNPLNYLKPKAYERSKFHKNDNLGSFFKTLIIKRFESSKYAFQNTISRFIEYHKLAIKMYDDDSFRIGSKNQNVYDLISSDEDELEDLIDQGDVEVYRKNDFEKEFIELLHSDLETLEKIQTLWQSVTKDFKLEKFIKELKSNKNLIDNKIILFSESKETCENLFDVLSNQVTKKCMLYTSQNAKIYENDVSTVLSKDQARDVIEKNFNPNIKDNIKKDDIRILISSDVLAEGVDLHRSNIVINYDLPWNPTRVIQRVGRVNRVGTKFKKILIFNFFPSVQGGEILNQEENITSKIQAIHDCLGNDAKYLTEKEETETYYLLGGKSGKDIFDSMNSKKTYEDDEIVDTRQKYINFIRRIRDNDPKLYEKIVALPKKIKTAKSYNKENGVITFFRKGRFKEFIFTDEQKKTTRLNFLDAIKYFQCKNTEKKKPIKKNFFDLLRQNKDSFFQILKTAAFSESDLTKNSNEFKIISLLNGQIFNNKSSLSDEDNDLLLSLRKLFADGRITPFVVKKIIKRLKEKEISNDPIKILYALKDLISPRLIKSAFEDDVDTAFKKKEIILSLNYYG